MRIPLTSMTKTATVAALLLITSVTSAQVTMKEVADAFNQGVQFASTNPELAVKSFEQAIKYADEVGGDEALGLRNQAMAQIPKLYFDHARALVSKNDLNGALAQLKNCIAAGEKYNMPQYANNARPTISAIYLSLGNAAFKSKNYTEAISNFNQSTEYNPRAIKAHLGKVLVFNEQGLEAEMVGAAIDGMNSNPVPNDMAVIEDIKRVVSNFYFNSAQTTMQAKNYSTTESNLLNAIKFGMDANPIVYYQLGLARMSMNKWDEAVEALMESVDLDEAAAAADKAKYFFNLGKSYEALGNAQKACESYKKALHGEFAQAAKFQIENVLKCVSE
ncbi:MAG: tetratricopeptide repeat protein [Bacteroidetes bacterium]|nr:tetratricopeptide repeat protein [Bacteroidota bacterium]